MKCSWSEIDLEWRSGSIHDMCVEAVEIAKLLDTKVSFLFNGVRVNVTKTSYVSTAAERVLDALRYDQTSVFI